MLLKQYAKKNNFQHIDNLVSQALKEKFLTEDISELDFDNEEKRFFGESVKISYKVFRQQFIKFRNSNEISISNSIITGDLICLSDSGPLKIFLDNCIILNELRFFGCDVNDTQISDCNISSIHFYNSTVKTCYISNCKIGKLSIVASMLQQLHSFCNFIGDIEKYQSKINEFQSNGDVIDLKGILKNDSSYINDLHVFLDTSFDTMAESLQDPVETRIETIKFLKESNLLSQKRDLLHLADLELSYLSEKTRLSRFIVKCFLGFTKPSLFFIFGVVIIFSFSIGYFLFGSISDGNQTFNSFWQAVYFSGVTFTTIGYGDIQPAGLTRVFAVIEGLLGVLTCSGFLVSLVNKYTKSN